MFILLMEAKVTMLSMSVLRVNRLKSLHLKTGEKCPSIDIEGNYAYIPNLSGEFHIVNISNPLNPSETASLNLVDSVKKLPGYNIPGAAFDVKVEGDYAYIIGYNCFYVVDISEKDNPVLSGFMAIGGNYLDVLGNYAFVTDNNWGLHVFDVSDPAKPSEVCYYSYRAGHKGNSAHQVTINPELEQANIFCDAGGLSIIDISDPLDPVLVSSIDNPQSVNHGAIKNNQIYIIEGDALYIIDGSAPDKPAKIKSFILPSGGDKLYPNFLATDDAYFYAGTSAGLVIFGYKNQ